LRGIERGEKNFSYNLGLVTQNMFLFYDLHNYFMSSMIGFCGLDCAKCDAYIATKKNDNKLRKKTAERWQKMFGYSKLDTKDINCDGCQSENKNLFQHCRVCKIRKCAKEKKMKNCAFCEEYSCQILDEFHKHAPEAKPNLENIRKKF